MKKNLTFTLSRENRIKAFLQNHPNFLKKIGIFGVCLVVAGLISWLLVLSPAQKAYAHLSALKTELSDMQNLSDDMNLEIVELTVASSQEHVAQAQKYLKRISWLQVLPFVGDDFLAGQDIVDTSGEVLDSVERFLLDTKPTLEKIGVFQNGGKGEVSTDGSVADFGTGLLDDIDSLQAALDQFRSEITLAKLRYGRIASGSYVGPIKNAALEVKSKIAQVSDLLDSSSDVLDFLPELLGQNQTKHYLLVIENNTEIRPGGGFWGNYGLLSIKDGKIEEIEINDIYKIDTDPKAAAYGYKVPYPLGSYLQQSYLHLRDSNWWPDLATSAAVMTDYYTFLTQQQVDGVIVLDPIFIEDIMRVIGPIEMAKYNVTVDTDNVTYQIQYQVHHNIISLDTRKDFVSELGEVLFARIMESGGDELKGIMKATFTDLNQKHVQIFAESADIENWLCKQKWCGEVPAVDGDSLSVVDANIGINKANFFTESNLDYQVHVQPDGMLESELSVLYQNASPGGWPGGIYTTYTRIYVPSGSELLDSSGFLSEVKKSVEFEGTSKERTVFSGIVRTQLESETEIKLRYRLPFTISGVHDYTLLVQKQAGTPTIPAQDDLRGYPLKFTFVDASNQYELTNTGSMSANKSDRTLEFQTDLTIDRDFSIELSK